MRRLIALLTLTIALLGLGVLPAVAGGPNNIVVADATADATGAATQVTRSRMVVQSTGTDDLTSQNIARAAAHDCTGCQAIAVAFQAVMVSGSPSTAAPKNLAVATNERCNSCASFAFAFQYVVSTDRPTRLTGQGRREIAALRQEVEQDLATDLTPQDLNARLEDVAQRFKAAVDADITRSGDRPHGGRVRKQEDRTPAPA
jgi:hypothetical protein